MTAMIDFHTPSGSVHPVVRAQVESVREPVEGEYGPAIRAVVMMQSGHAIGVRETVVEAKALINRA